MNSKKRTTAGISSCLASVLIVSLALSGCGDKTSLWNNPADVETITENTMPITTEDITFDCWRQNLSQGYVKSYIDFCTIVK